MMNLLRKHTPGAMAQGLPGRGLRKLFIPIYRRCTGRVLDQFQAEWVVQGYVNRGLQTRFALRDRLLRMPYKKISCETEFGPELKYYLPYAYWHHRNGTLSSTRSFQDTRSLYFFSPNHTEHEGSRRYILDPNVPNSEDHNFNYNFHRWARVPLKETYQNRLRFAFEKPLVVISNKYNDEWGKGPINFLSPEFLEKLIRTLSSRYSVVYNRPSSQMIASDHNDVQDWDEKRSLRQNHPALHFAEDLFAAHKSECPSFNEFQLSLYAQCTRFISVQGGNSVLASYFGGTNLIFQRQGQEIFFRELETIYPRLAGTACFGFADYDSLYRAVEQHYLPS
ncbi:MAG TPA: hypothetical protein VFT72_09075 [Opitutaceae bacterium]|nr:hypothetical protein [Opitutaceae bacterium]